MHHIFGLGPELSLAWRRLLRAPALSLFSVATLAVAIGAITAVYAAVSVVTGPPPGIPNADRVFEVYRSPAGSLPQVGWSWPDYQEFRQRQTAYSQVAGWSFFRQVLASERASTSGSGEMVDGSYFAMLGVTAAVGRLFGEQDDRPDAPPLCVISHATWQRLFDGAPDVVGQPLKINGVSFQVIGVTAPEFVGLFNGGLVPTMAWVPFSAVRSFAGLADAEFDSAERSRRWMFVYGRLTSGADVRQATAEVVGFGRQFDEELAATAPGRRIATAWGTRPVRRVVGVPDAIVNTLLTALAVAVALVALVACTNLASLMLARNASRRAEMSVRVALGATRRRLVLAGSLEALILSLGGALLGLVVARWLVAVFSTELPIAGGSTLQMLPTINAVALVVTLVATAVALLIVGVVPALLTTRGNLGAGLSSDTGSTLPRWRGRRLLVAFQVGASVLLVSVSTLYVGEIHRQRQVDTGIDLDHLAFMHVDFGRQRYDDASAREIATAVVEQIGSRSDVQSVAVSAGFPLGLSGFAGGTVRSVAHGTAVSTPAQVVAGSPALLETLGVSLLHGRGIATGDLRGAEPVAVLSDRTAGDLFGVTDPLGQQIVLTLGHMIDEPARPDQTLTVVGIAADTDAGTAGSRGTGVVYLALDQQSGANLVVSVRARTRPEPLVTELRNALTTVAPAAAPVSSGTGRALASPRMLFLSVVAGIAGALGVTALVLALAGLYGVLSHVVAGRTRELGLRIALGADPGRVERMVLREGLHPVLVGVAAGLCLGMVTRAALQPVFLRIVPAVDLSLIVIVPVLFIVAGAVAAFLPARRASRVEPNVALRDR